MLSNFSTNKSNGLNHDQLSVILGVLIFLLSNAAKYLELDQIDTNASLPSFQVWKVKSLLLKVGYKLSLVKSILVTFEKLIMLWVQVESKISNLVLLAFNSQEFQA